MIEASGATVEHVAGDRAYYRVAEDKVVLPNTISSPRGTATTKWRFTNAAHSTGHPDRMNRDTLKDGDGARVWIARVCPRRITRRD